MGQQGNHDAFELTHALGDIGCDKVKDFVGNVETILCGLHGKELAAQILVGLLQLYCHAPLETGDEPGLHAIEVTRAAVAGHHQLALVLVQMVEDVEEGILRARLASKELDVIKQEHVDTLIEINEVVDFLLLYGSRVLALEHARRYIQHPHARVILLELDTYSLQQVSLANAGLSKDEQGVVGLHLGVLGNRLTDAHGKPVAHAAAIVLEGVSRVELGVNVLEHILALKGIGDTRLADLEILLELNAGACLGLLDGTGIVMAHYIKLIEELDVLSKHLFQGSLEDIEIAALDLLDKELRGNPERHTAVFLVKVNGNNGCEPSIKLLGRHISLDDVKAAVPLLCNVIHYYI